MSSMFNKKVSAKTTAITPIQINGVVVTNVEEAVAQINSQLSNISVGADGGITTVVNAKTYDSGNFNTSYVYYADGKIQKETIVGDVNRITEYTYLENGRIATEKITESGKSVTRTFSYDSKEKIIGISVTTV